MPVSQYEIYFDNLLNNMIEGVSIHQLVLDENNIPIDYIILKVNKGFEQILGYKKSEVEGKLATIVYGDVPALDVYSEVVLNKTSKIFEFYYPSMDKYFDVSTFPWNDIGFITIFTDITDRIVNQKKMEHINDFNKNLLQTIPFGMEIIDQQGKILFLNEKMKDKVGNVLGQKCWNIHRDNKKQCSDCPLFLEIEIGKTEMIETTGIYGGKIYEISHTGIIFNNEKAILEIFQDITDRKETEFRLAKAEIIAKTGNWELHLDNQIIIASEGAMKIYGLYNDHIKYETIKKYVLPEYRQMLDDALKDLIENNKNYDVEFEIKTDDNVIKTIHSIANYNKNDRIFGVLQDVTKERKNEIALEKSNAVKTTFLSNISHELRTPLNAIIGFSDIIYSDLFSKSQNNNFDRFIKSINSNAKHLDELLNNILDYSKIESNAVDILYEEFSIFDIFEELLNIFEDVNYKQNLDFVKLNFIMTEDKKIVSDYLRLKQILYNIISNSIKFTERGHINISFSLSNNNVLFKIEDTGIGISEDKIPFVFDRFWQVDSGSRKRYKGTGLGLSISKSLVEFLNGKIWLESTPGNGSTFYVSIPMTENKKNDILDFPGKTILIIDDVPSMFSLLGIYLNSLHVDIISVNEKEAIEIYKKQKDKIDLIILDIDLYEMNYINLIESLKEINNCKIISKSIYKKTDITDYHLNMPIDKDKLLQILNKIWQK